MYHNTCDITPPFCIKNNIELKVSDVGSSYNNLKNCRTYVGTDGKLHSVDGTGADTVLNFNAILKNQSAVHVTKNATLTVEKDKFYLFANYAVRFTSSATVMIPVISGADIISGGDNHIALDTYTHSGGNNYSACVALYVIKTKSTSLTFANMNRTGILLKLS